MGFIQENTCAVIVTFNPDEGFLGRLKKIERQLAFIIVVDNSPDENLYPLLDGKSKKVMLLSNPANLGIATALNQGITKAGDMGYQWIITFDQDSVVEDNLLSTLASIYLKINNSFSIIGSNYLNTNKKGIFLSCKNSDLLYVEKKTVITSGMFFHLDVIKRIGNFKDAYFIDSVDHEFCLRARSKQCKVYISCAPLMRHSIGEIKNGSGVLNSLVFSHSADRVYYMARNTVVTVRKFFIREWVWGGRQFLRLSVEMLAISLTKKDRGDKLIAFARGISHGVLGRMGKITNK